MCVSFTNEYISISMSTSRFHMYVYRYSKFFMSSSILLHSHTTHPQTIDALPPYPEAILQRARCDINISKATWAKCPTYFIYETVTNPSFLLYYHNLATKT